MTAIYDHPNHSFRVEGSRVQCTGCPAHFFTNVKERILMAVPVPTPCRLELWTPTGWQKHVDFVMLLSPERYPERLEERLKYGRAVELDPATMQPTGQVWAPRKLPPRAKLVRTDSAAWGLPDPNRRGMCHWCSGYHGDPFDGSCLI